MKNHKTKEGKYGLICQIAEGVTLSPSRQGTWEVCIIYKGKRDRTRFGKDFDRAMQFAELMVAKLGLPVQVEQEDSHYTVENATEDWISNNRAKWSPNTLERYSGIVRDFVLPSIGKKPLAKVDRQTVKDLLKDILAIRSVKTVELIHCVISGIFAEAIDNGLVAENPAHGLTRKILPPKRKRNESAPDPFSKEDLDAVLEAAKNHLETRVAMAIETLAMSGMRLGEYLAAHRDYLDAGKCQYMIVETVRHGKLGLPKSGKRLIDLPEDLVMKLEWYVLQLRREALHDGKQVGYLFPGVTQRMVQRGLERACRLAIVRLRSPHDLRHSYASILLMDHYSPAYVQKQLGHHSITMTVDTYGHWIPGEGRKDLGKTLGRSGMWSSARQKTSAEPKVSCASATLSSAVCSAESSAKAN